MTEKSNKENGDDFKKGLVVGGIRAIESFLKGISIQQQNKDPVDEAINDCEDTLAAILENRKKQRKTD